MSRSRYLPALAACLLLSSLSPGPVWTPVWTVAAQPTAAQQADRAQQLFIRGLTRAQFGDHEAALKHYEQALQLAPEEPSLLSAMASSQAELGDAASALYYARQARTLAPENVHYHRQVATLLLDAGDATEAADAYATLLERFPHDDEALRALARLQTRLARYEAAAATYEALLTQRRNDPAALQPLLQLYLRLGDAAGTERTLQTLIELDASNPTFRRMLGEHFIRQAQTADALAVFEEAVDEGITDQEMILALADLYRGQGDTARAEALLDASTPSEDATPEALMAQALALYDRATSDAEAAAAAARILERVLSHEPEHPRATALLGTLRLRAGAFGEAASLLATALEQNPRDLDLWARAAAAHRQAGDPEQALAVAEEGLLLFPEQPALVREEALALFAQGSAGGAVERLEEALGEAEGDASTQAELLDALGWIYLQQEQLREAKTYLEEAVDTGAASAGALEHYGDVLARLGDVEQARRYWRDALARNPTSAALQQKLEQAP